MHQTIALAHKLYNPKTNRIIYSRDVQWMDFKGKTLDDNFNLFEPGIKSTASDKETVHSGENELDEESLDSNSTISTNTSDNQSSSSESSTSINDEREDQQSIIELSSESSTSSSENNNTTTTRTTRRTNISKPKRERPITQPQR